MLLGAWRKTGVRDDRDDAGLGGTEEERQLRASESEAPRARELLCQCGRNASRGAGDSFVIEPKRNVMRPLTQSLPPE